MFDGAAQSIKERARGRERVRREDKGSPVRKMRSLQPLRKAGHYPNSRHDPFLLFFF